MENGCRGSYTADDKFVQCPDCPYFPCHDDVPIEEFNCRFCYCALYFIEDCGGNYEILDNGIKDCSNCSIPHRGVEGHEYVVNTLTEEVF